ncbi:MAG: hypothetical protein WC378_19970 [Opitutaceae bacterium]|jgi:hypothetical protein
MSATCHDSTGDYLQSEVPQFSMLSQGLGQAPGYWGRVRRAASQLLWRGEVEKARSTLWKVVNRCTLCNEPAEAYCALTDLLFLALEYDSLPQIEHLRGECSRMIEQYGDPSWCCRFHLMEAMGAWRRGRYDLALRTVLEGWEQLPTCFQIAPYSIYTFGKWAALSALALGNENLLLKTLPQRLPQPGTGGFDALRWYFIETLRGRMARRQGQAVPWLAAAARNGLEIVRELQGIQDERYGLLRALILAGESGEFSDWARRLPLDNPYQAQLLWGDFHLGRLLARQGESLPDWDLPATGGRAASDAERRAGQSKEPDRAAASSAYRQADDFGVAEDFRLASRVHQRAARRRLAYLAARFGHGP